MLRSSNAHGTTRHRAGAHRRKRASGPSAVPASPPLSRTRCPCRCRARSARTRCARDGLPAGRDGRRPPPPPGGARPFRDWFVVRLPASWLSPESFSDQITRAEGDEKRARGMFLHLLLNAALQLVEIRITKPCRAGLHSLSDRVGHRRDARVTGYRHRRSVRRRSRGQFVLPQCLSTGLESVGEHRWYGRRLLLDAGRDALHASGDAAVLGAGLGAALSFRITGGAIREAGLTVTDAC